MKNSSKNMIFIHKHKIEVTYGLTECKRKLRKAWFQLQGMKNSNNSKNTLRTPAMAKGRVLLLFLY